jgi:hypothetical protein
MSKELPVELLKVVAARVVDLRAEFEAQLRAVARLEDTLRKIGDGKDEHARRLADVLARELREMLANNTDIRDVLTELEQDAQTR